MMLGLYGQPYQTHLGECDQSHMQLQQLAYFVAVAEARHFTQAAERMRVAQPSLSKQIKALETELGAPLFSRARGNVMLTAAGEALLPLARRMLADADTARQEVAELAGLRRGRVRLGATPSLCAGLLADALARFHSDYPGIELLVEEGGSRDLVRALARGQLDLSLVITPLQHDDPSLVTEEILRESLVVVAPTSEQEPRRKHLHIQDLRGKSMVMFRRGYDLREATLAACRNAGFEPRFAVEGGEMDAVLRFVEAGLGVAVVPSMVLEGRPGLRGTPLAGLSRTIALAHRKDVEPTRAAQAFRTALRAFLVEAGNEGTLPEGVELIAE